MNQAWFFSGCRPRPPPQPYFCLLSRPSLYRFSFSKRSDSGSRRWHNGLVEQTGRDRQNNAECRRSLDIDVQEGEREAGWHLQRARDVIIMTTNTHCYRRFPGQLPRNKSRALVGLSSSAHQHTVLTRPHCKVKYRDAPGPDNCGTRMCSHEALT